MGDEFSNEVVMRVAGMLLLASSALAIVGTWGLAWLGSRLRIPRDIQFAIIWILAIIPCVAFVVSCVSMPGKYNIRMDLLIYPCILAVVVANAVGVTMSMRKS